MPVGAGPQPAGRRYPRRVHVIRALACSAALVGLLGACGAPDHRFVKASPTLQYQVQVGNQEVPVPVKAATTFFRLPRGYTTIDEARAYDRAGALDSLTPVEQVRVLQKQELIVFDGAPDPDPLHFFSRTASAPVGLQLTLALSDQERDTVSLSTLRNYIFDIDADLSSLRPGAEPPEDPPKVDIIGRDDEVVRDGGLRGHRIRYTIQGDGGGSFAVDQTVLIDERSRVLYAFLVGCDVVCFGRHQDVVEDIVSSWTIKD